MLKFSSENGLGLVMVLVAIASIIIVWFFFNMIMDGIGARHGEKRKMRKEMDQAARDRYKPKPRENRKIRGYTVKIE